MTEISQEAVEQLASERFKRDNPDGVYEFDDAVNYSAAYQEEAKYDLEECLPAIQAQVLAGVKERLEKRLRNILIEQTKCRLTTADGKSTLREDESPNRGRRSEAYESGNGKTRAEKAAERARINALCESLGLLTNRDPVEVELHFRDNLYEDNAALATLNPSEGEPYVGDGEPILKHTRNKPRTDND